jgi:protein tyrosine phosphatase (PTP) superfamily phosphohydrolase (DUF442 family)
MPTKPVDVVTGATPRSTGTQEMIPKDPYYKVLGKAAGLKGTIIRYDENLFRGGDVASEKGMQALKAHGIKTIVAVTPSEEQRRWAEDAGIAYKEIKFDFQSIPDDLQVVVEDLFQTAPPPFYVHCHSGTTRAGVLAMIYRIKVQGWSFDRALIEFGRLGGNLSETHGLTQSIISKGDSTQPVATDKDKPHD